MSLPHIAKMVSFLLILSMLTSFGAECGQEKSGYADVIVVGAGISGLTAALTLAKKGVDVLLLEKESQVGGRLMSVPLGGIPCNLGAQWIIAGLQPEVDPFIKRFQVQPLQSNLSFVWDGKLVKFGESGFGSNMSISPQAQQDFVAAMAKMIKDADALFKGKGRDFVFDLPSDSDLWKKLEKQTIAEYLAPYHPDVTKLWGERVGAGFGGTANDISALFLVAWYRGNPSIPMALIKGGNQLLAEEMLKDCKKAGTKLVLGADVTEVVQKGKSVKVRCRNGKEYSSDFVIVTIPAPAANKIVKGLSPEKRKALKAVDFNTLTEVGLHVKNFPKGNELAGLLFVGGNIAGCINQTGDIAGNPDTGTVIAVTVIKSNMQKLADKELVLQVAKELKAANPSFDPLKDVLGYSIKRWKLGEVHITPGFLSKYLETLQAHSGNVYFAGDYVSNIPTWGGAVWAGSKAAKEVLTAMGK